jgi:hypothetical protein
LDPEHGKTSQFLQNGMIPHGLHVDFLTITNMCYIIFRWLMSYHEVIYVLIIYPIIAQSYQEHITTQYNNKYEIKTFILYLMSQKFLYSHDVKNRKILNILS